MDEKPKRRCKNGERWDPVVKDCVKMTEEMIKHKQALRNKKKGVIKDDTGNIVRPNMRVINKKIHVLPKDSEVTVEPITEDLVDHSIDHPEEIVSLSIDEPSDIIPLRPPSPESNSESSEESNSESSEEPNQEPNPESSEESQRDNIDLYPELGDPDFAFKIAQRKEFADTQYDGEIVNIREQANRFCSAPFELLPHQLFVRNFLSFQTPYNSLLLYHGLGSGKTCSAIGIAEEMRAYMKQMGITKRIIIVASPNVQDNFRLQLFDERRLEQLPDGTWNLNTCIGNSLLQEINPTNLRGLSREKIVAQIRSLINQSYVFMGNKGEFANYIQKVVRIPADSGYSEKEISALRERKIKAHFNNRLVVLDEIHNIRISDANKTKLTSVLLNEIARKSDNMRLLLLSATPMYNSFNEIIWLTNLLNANDNRPTITIEQVFKPDGTWVQPRGSIEGGKELLIRKLTGYISYVRGENPYVFPYRIYPEIFAPDHLITRYPSKQMNQVEITEPLQFIPIYKNGIGAYQSEGYDFIINYLGLKSTVVTDKQGKERAMPSFENMENFGYTLLLAPLEALIITYPHAKLQGSQKPKTEKESKDIIKNMIGKHGLANIMKFSRTEKPVPRRFDYEYKPAFLKQFGPIFHPNEIGKYSAKISNICEILRRPSKGIIIIYSQYIDGGLVPMALALESMGFSRYASTHDHSRGLLKTPVEPIDSLTMRTKHDVGASNFRQARYVMITGEKDFSQNNNEDIKYVTNKVNSEGEFVKVILISMAASEGLDFKNIRQIHILEPWYNMNRVEQIIGRGVRNLSHCDLEFENRNVEIYLHGTLLDKDEEAADMYVYRSAEKKAVQIGRVTRVLKETAVDCVLNIGQTNFTEAKLFEEIENQNIQIRLSSSPQGTLIPFRVGDKPRTEVCDYMADCEFKCAVREDPLVINSDTYDESFVKTNSVVIMKKIRDLFREKMVYSREHLIAAINSVKKYPLEHIYYALTRFIQNKNEGLIDKYGRSGYLVSRDEYYAFQPSEIMDETISTFERSVPVDYKPVSLLLEVPKEIVPWSYVESTMDKESEVSLSSAVVDSAVEAIDAVTLPNARTYVELIHQITGITAILANKDVRVKATQNDWYKHASKAVEELMLVHEMKIEWIQKYAIFHYLDKLPISDKLVLVTQTYLNDEIKHGIDIILKLYFDEIIMEAVEDGESKTGIILADGPKNQLYVKEGELWRMAAFTDEKLFAPVRKEILMIPPEKIHRTEIGFMHPFKDKEVVFKTKDLTQKRNNTGAKCTDASKQSIAAKIGVVLGQLAMYTATQIEKPELCVLLEIIMRWKTESRNIYYFFGPERTNEMKISTLHW